MKIIEPKEGFDDLLLSKKTVTVQYPENIASTITFNYNEISGSIMCEINTNNMLDFHLGGEGL